MGVLSKGMFAGVVRTAWIMHSLGKVTKNDGTYYAVQFTGEDYAPA